jgi:hypothetical protein
MGLSYISPSDSGNDNTQPVLDHLSCAFQLPTLATIPEGLAHAIPHFLITAFRRVAKELHLASIKRIDDQE